MRGAGPAGGLGPPARQQVRSSPASAQAQAALTRCCVRPRLKVHLREDDKAFLRGLQAERSQTFRATLRSLQRQAQLVPVPPGYSPELDGALMACHPPGFAYQHARGGPDRGVARLPRPRIKAAGRA